MMAIKTKLFFKMTKKIKILLTVFFLLGMQAFSARESLANNLSISNFSVYNTNTSAKTITFSCNVSWENSWLTTTNHDAIWVFLKYSTDGGINWSHASMYGSGTNPAGFYAPNNFEIIVPSDEKGFFVRRSDYGTGSVSAQNLRLVWDYGQDGLSDSVAMAANTVNKIFGIEMVYIPQGAFYAGDGNSSSPYRFKEGSAGDNPWYIQNEDSFWTTNTPTGGKYYLSSGLVGENASGDLFNIQLSYPKGYGAFYLMKYELTEKQWVGFFNTLSIPAKINRDITSGVQGGKSADSVIARNTIAWDGSKPYTNATTQRPDRPVTFVSWPDAMAFADWAGLRPITELEYEKAARGADNPSHINEFAWGNASYAQAGASDIVPANLDENGTEYISTAGANLNVNTTGWHSGDGRTGGVADSQVGPLRGGIFARPSTDRVLSGAGYYGNMDLSGNLAEMVVTIGRQEGRDFQGSNGDGQLTSASGYEGNATNQDWPGFYSADPTRGVIGTVGSGTRGGHFNSSTTIDCQISSRSFVSKDPDSLGKNQRFDSSFGVYQGGRLGRTAP